MEQNDKPDSLFQSLAEKLTRAALDYLNNRWVRVEDVQKLIEDYKLAASGRDLYTPYSVYKKLETLLPQPPKE